MRTTLVHFAVVLIGLWIPTCNALEREAVVRKERAGREEQGMEQSIDDISIPSYELEGEAVGQEQLTQELSYETAWPKSGKRRVTIMRATINDEPEPKHTRHHSESRRNLHEKIRGPPKRTKRKIYGFDNRRYVPRKYTQYFPFNTTVKVSTGCTGIAVSPLHVLTSAHCIHTGKEYDEGFDRLRVGSLQRDGTFRWESVVQTHLPRNWTAGLDPGASRFDYAILKLSRRHAHSFLPIALSEGSAYGSGQRIHFTAFEDDKPTNTIWYRHCSVINATRNMLFHCCDAKPGSSGAGLYVYYHDNNTQKHVRKVIGIFSGFRPVHDQPDWPRCPYDFGRHPNYNFAIRINSINFRQMCKWMGKNGGEDCRRVTLEDKRRKRRRRRRRNRQHRRNTQTTQQQNGETDT